jgi:hypothetical protein
MIRRRLGATMKKQTSCCVTSTQDSYGIDLECEMMLWYVFALDFILI